MKNRSLILLLTLALSAASAQSAQPGNAVSADTRLSKANVTFKIVRDGTGLMALLTAVAKSAGYELILDPALDSLITPGVGSGSGVTSDAATPQAAQPGVSATQLTYDFASKPFNQVWPFLMDVYGLNYDVVKLGSSEVLRVGKNPIQRIVVLPKTLDASLVGERVKLAFGTRQMSAPVAVTTGSPAPQTAGGDIVLDSPTLKIVGEPISNSLIIRGNNQEVSQVEALVKEIIASQPPELAKVVVPVSPVIQSIYNVKGAQDDAVALIKDQYPSLAVTAVGKTGQLILSGQKAQIDAALTLLTQVDRAPSVQQNPDVRQQVYGVKGSQTDIAALLTAQFPALKITPVGTTGQLVLNGTQDQLDAAAALLSQVDKAVTVSSGPDIQQKVFQLVNASAEELKKVLDNTLQTALTAATNNAPAALPNVPVTAIGANGEATTVSVPNAAANSSAAPTATAPVMQDPTAATIIADKRTNTLIVRGTAQQVEQVAVLIPSLDQVVPQVNVQVRIQEITEDAARTLGLNWKVGFGGFNVSSGPSGLAASFDPTRALVGGFNLLPTLNALENQTQTKRIYDGSVTMQSGQRSLGGGASTNASSGAAASIKSGGRLELNIPSASGNIVRQIDYGINLDFFDPQVAPDGSITLRVRGQINQPKTAITGSTLPNLLDFSNSEAQSVITFKSGQTLLLSGLLGSNESNTTSGTPYLSSLPIIGAAFGQKSTSKTQSQLMVVITGTVVK
ncbi:secretin [Deinococcus psychrotolerans]|uniref:Secretin n=1 Tax=Deinococcus psychrotolerans TaxID=2489213 RepID=A0A3G8YNK7_9DEIO|nr:secretin N-terminal domain-containing protein [Deinococcus psychrotolerans]AZI42726.1 secretin [Deinococcus psychrotolerans]